jgi:hypothetical protein
MGNQSSLVKGETSLPPLDHFSKSS